MRYKASKQVFGVLTTEFENDGTNDKNNISSLEIEIDGACYPLEVETQENNGIRKVKIIFNGSGERDSFLDCMRVILLKESLGVSDN